MGDQKIEFGGSILAYTSILASDGTEFLVTLEDTLELTFTKLASASSETTLLNTEECVNLGYLLADHTSEHEYTFTICPNNDILCLQTRSGLV